MFSIMNKDRPTLRHLFRKFQNICFEESLLKIFRIKNTLYCFSRRVASDFLTLILEAKTMEQYPESSTWTWFLNCIVFQGKYLSNTRRRKSGRTRRRQIPRISMKEVPSMMPAVWLAERSSCPNLISTFLNNILITLGFI